MVASGVMLGGAGAGVSMDVPFRPGHRSVAEAATAPLVVA